MLLPQQLSSSGTPHRLEACPCQSQPLRLCAGISLSALSPLTTVIAAANAQTAAPAPEAAPPTNRKLLAGRSALAAAQAAALQQRAQRRRVLAAGFDFGIASEEASGSSNVSTSYGDPLAASLAGDQAAYDLLAKNQELVCTGGIGGSLLAALAGGGSTTAAAGAGAVFDQLAGDLLAGGAGRACCRQQQCDACCRHCPACLLLTVFGLDTLPLTLH